MGLSFALIYAKAESGEWSDVLRWSQRVIDLADGDPSKGNFIFGSPLALAFATRAMARLLPGSSRMARRPSGTAWPWPAAPTRCPTPRSSPPSTSREYRMACCRPDDSAVREIEDALRIAERSGDDLALAYARATLGVALVHRPTAAERDRGQQLLSRGQRRMRAPGDTSSAMYRSSTCTWHGRGLGVEIATNAIPLMRAAVDHLVREGQLLGWGVFATAALVETLLGNRGSDADVQEAAAAIERLAAVPTDPGFVLNEIPLLRLRALLAHAHGDEAGYRDYRDRYRAMATSLGFEGHMKWAEAMP